MSSKLGAIQTDEDGLTIYTTNLRGNYMKRYTDNPLQVRLYESQEQSLNSMMQDHEYLKQRGIFNKSDAVRTALFSVIKDYEKYKFNRSITA